MAKKKRKTEEILESGDVEENVSEGRLAEGTKRSVAAIACVFLAIVCMLGFFHIAGWAGEHIDTFIGSVFGWGKWLFPVVLLFFGWVLLKKTVRFYFVSIVGMGAAYFSILGFFHIFFDVSIYSEIASLGRGGGYVGYGLSSGLVFLFGKIGAVATLAVLFLIGILVAFNFSLLPLIEKIQYAGSLRIKKQSKKAAEIQEDDREQNENVDIGEEVREGDLSSFPLKKEESSLEKENLKKLHENIGSIRFHSADAHGEEDDELSSVEKLRKNSFQSEKSAPLGYGYTFEQYRDLPSLDLLDFPKTQGREKGKDTFGDIEQNRQIIQDTLAQFGIVVDSGGEKFGPTVTQYMFRPAPGVKLERITALANNLAMALSAQSIRIEAPIPGQSLVGIEVPNRKRDSVRLREILEDASYCAQESSLRIPLGKRVSGEIVFADLETMPHLLIAGTTGSGKSICINAILASLLFQNTPDTLQCILVDPKRVELSLYDGIPHLKTGVIVENKKVLGALRWAVGEMERRYQMLQEQKSRDILAYNRQIAMRRKSGEAGLPAMPYLVIVIDELADLMGTHGKEVEGAIVRLAQMARAVGIHLIVATQRPDVRVLTGLIKTNISARIAFKVPTQIDSRTILDKGGAEKLLGLGDMLYVHANNPSPIRIQGVFVSTDEVKKVTNFWKREDKRSFEEKKESFETSDEEIIISSGNRESFGESLDIEAVSRENIQDALFSEAKELVERTGKASTSFIQRYFRIGYNRAARIVDELEAAGIVGPADGAKPREVYSFRKEGASSSEENGNRE